MREILVEARLVYGTWRIYPKNAAAEALAQIAGDATLTPKTLRLVKLLGHEVIEAERPAVLSKLMEA